MKLFYFVYDIIFKNKIDGINKYMNRLMDVFRLYFLYDN